jgi:hypothetical protein
MFVQSPSRSKTTRPNLRQVDPSARGGSLDSFFRGRAISSRSGGWKGGGSAVSEKSIVNKNGSGFGNGSGNGNGSGSGSDKGRINAVKPNRRKKPANGAASTRKGPKASRLIMWSLIIGALGYGYITHVFSTQQVNSEVNELRRQFENVQATHASQALTYDRMTGPAEVYRRARELGFIDPGPADHVIIID